MPPFNPKDVHWDTYGKMLAALKFVTPLIGSAILVIELLMVVSILVHYLALPADKRRDRLPFILVSLLILGASWFSTSVDILMCFRVLLAGGPDGISYARVNPTIYEEHKIVTYVGAIWVSIIIIAGDALMLWRCFVLWSEKKWVVIFPTLCFLANVALALVDNAWLFIITDQTEMVERSRKVSIAYLALTVGTNIVVTSLILLRVMMTWRQARRAFPDGKRPAMYTNVVGILVESAAPLAVFGICLLVTRGIRMSPAKDLLQAGRVAIVRGVASWVYYGFCALSPQMIIYRVTTGQSWINPTQASSAALSQPIRFNQTQNGRQSQTSGESDSL